MQTLHSYFLPYITRNRQEFIKKLSDVCDYLMCDINDLAAVMWRESKITENAVNPSSNAAGLIQIMPSTAKALGTSTEALLAMSNVEQLDYVKKYLAPYRGNLSSFTDIYTNVFYPAGAGKPNNWIFPDAVHDSNTGLDLNSDGTLTMAEFKAWILKDFPIDIQKLLKKK